MKIDYENTHTREMGDIEMSQVMRERTFQELISDFYGMMYGCEISEEEMKVMSEVAREAGVANETD